MIPKVWVKKWSLEPIVAHVREENIWIWGDKDIILCVLLHNALADISKEIRNMIV